LTIAVAAVGLLVPAGGSAKDFSPEALAMREAARSAGVTEVYLPRETPAEARANKLTLAPWEQKITTMVRNRLGILKGEDILRDGRRNLAQQYSTEIVEMDELARLRIECKVDDVTPFDEAYFESIGGELVVRAIGYGLLVAWIPAEQMEMFASRPDVRLIMHIDPPFTDVGSVDTEGDTIHRADEARADFDISGLGQVVGAISDGVSNLAVSQASGDLPPFVALLPGCVGAGDEGTAMLEIIHDLAPNATLAFCTGHPGMASMVNAINALAALPGMTVITDDLPKPGEPLFEDGPIAQAKQNAVAAGIFYTASAGNRGNQHYEDNYNSTAANVPIGPNVYDNPHDFGGGDFLLSITLAASNSIYLQWAEPFGASGIDLDLYVLDAAGNVIASSTAPQNGAHDPNEVVSFGATAGTAANILVDYVGGGAPPTVFFDLRAWGVTWNEYLVPEGSMNGASRQAEVYAAGASDAANPTAVRGFSSKGPIRHFFPAPLTRMKPDAIAVNGVSITGAGGFGSGTCPMVVPGDCRFFGTSASTPHVAGLVALILEACPGLTPAEVANLLNTTAVDIDLPGRDNNAGYGLLDVFAAIFPPVGFLDDEVSEIFDPPDPWVQEGLIVDTICVVPNRNLLNLRFFSDPLQCEDVLCEPGDVKKIHESLVQFVPDEIAYVPEGETLCVEVKISVPIGQHAGNYVGVVHAIAEIFECIQKITDDLVLTLDVRPTVDLDVDDNHGNVSDNVLHLKGAKGTTVSGVFTVVNPNSQASNVDLPDGPGNIRIEPVSVSSTDLVKIGDPAEMIPVAAVSFDPLASLASGEAADVQVDVDIPDDIPINAVYTGTVTVTYDECVHARRPNRHMLGGGPVSDEFTLEIELLPTQGPLDIVDAVLSEDFCPPDPWTQVGQIEYTFEVEALGDHRNIRVSSGGLKHDSLDKKLDDFNFFPEEIAFLAAGETREVSVIVKVPIGQHAGKYSGLFRVVSENGGEDSIAASASVCVHPDLDIEDDLANLSSNIMHLEGPRSGVAYGTFSLVNPNCTESNIDRLDGPGNLALKDLVATPSDLWFAAGGPPPKEPIPASLIDIDIYPDPSHLPSGAGAYGVLQVHIPKKSQHWVPGYNFEYWGDVEVQGYVSGDSVADGFKIELRVLKAIGGGQLSGFWGERIGDENLLHWSELGLLESGYNLYRNDLKVADVGKDVFEFADRAETRAAHEYRLGVQVGGSEIMIGPITIGGRPVPAVYILFQNHPNPFRRTTAIRYQMPATGHISLKIYDVTGKLVRTLEDTEKSAGFYTVEWDGTDDSGEKTGNGVYFYRITSGDFCKNLKMTLMR
jgi:hypothetical protein